MELLIICIPFLGAILVHAALHFVNKRSEKRLREYEKESNRQFEMYNRTEYGYGWKLRQMLYDTLEFCSVNSSYTYDVENDRFTFYVEYINHLPCAFPSGRLIVQEGAPLEIVKLELLCPFSTQTKLLQILYGTDGTGIRRHY